MRPEPHPWYYWTMDTMASALWDLYENQKLKGLAGAMRQTLLKIEMAGHADSRWFNAMGELALLEKDFAAAARFFQKALAGSDKPEYELNLGNALYYAGDLKAAKQVLRAFLDKYPQDGHVVVNLANCHLKLGELERAKSLCLKNLTEQEGKGGAAPLWNCLGQAAYLDGDCAHAYDYFNRAYDQSPDYVDALFNRANMAYRLGRRDEALRDLELCIRKDENHEAALLNAAVIHLEKEEPGKGRETLARVLRLNPRSVDAWHLLGRIHLLSREYRQARDAFREALKSDALHAPTLIALARLHLQESEHEEARGILRRLLANTGLASEEETATLSLLVELQENALCIQHIQKVPDAELDVSRRKVLVLSLWRDGRTKAAISHLEKLLAAEGETAETLALLGRMLSQSGAESLAEQRLRRALELDPGSRPAGFELTRILMERGDVDPALIILKELQSRNPEDPDCLYNLACCLSRLGNAEAGLRMLEQAVEHGFQDLDKIGADEDLETIRQFKEFARLAGQTGI